MNRLMPQTGVGIEIRGDNLYAFCAKSFWGRVRIIDALEIHDFRQLGTAECGQRYRDFLRKNGLKSPWTVVALPRGQVLVRPLRFPSGIEKDLQAAIALQLDVLHPFEESAILWDFAPVSGEEALSGQGRSGEAPQSSSNAVDVLVAIAEKPWVEELAAWFQEAAIPVSQFTASTALLLTTLGRSFRRQATPGSPFLALHVREDGCELVGAAIGKPLLSMDISWMGGTLHSEEDVPALARHLEQAHSELRLEPEARPLLLLCGTFSSIESALRATELPFQVSAADSLLPSGSGNVAERSIAENVLGAAAAVAAAENGPRLALNLLPAERRSYQSPFAYTTTYALASMVLLLAIGMGLRGSIQDWAYGRRLERERQSLLPAVQELERLQGASRETLANLAALSAIRQSGALPLQLLDELTRILPSDAWLQQLQYEGSTVTMSGTAQSASAVLQSLSASSYLEAPQFSAALTRTPDGKEVFRIGARLRNPNP
jgi:Tfp pilus assembly protein PilN